MTSGNGSQRETAATSRKKFSRRSLITGVALGGGAVVVAGAAGIGVRGETNGVWNPGQGAPYEMWQDWSTVPGLGSVVAAGVLAANPHNIQPWTFVVSDSHIEIHDDPTRKMPITDSDSRERIAGYGCAIENMIVAARSFGKNVKVSTWPSTDRSFIARLDFSDGAAPSSPEKQLAEAIPMRHSNRGPYSSDPVDQRLLHSLSDPTNEVAQIVWITEPAAMARIGELYVEATQAITADTEMSTESSQWFRNDRPDIDEHRDGLTLDCQGLDGFTAFMAKILPAQSRADSDAFWVKTTRETLTATARAYGIVRVTNTDDPAARLAGGRAIQHVHLTATQHGLGMQHMNQVTERIARDAAQSDPDVFSQRWSQAIGFPASQSLIAFRVGYPERPGGLSPRRPLGDVIQP